MQFLARRILRLAVVAALLLFLTYIQLSGNRLRSPSETASLFPSHGYAWAFDAERDALNYSLSSEQCEAAFPNLYFEIQRAVKYWQNRNHTISEEDIELSWRDDGAFRLLIHENKARMLESRILETNRTYGNYSQRTSAVLQQIRRALSGASAVGQAIPTIEFSVTVEDLNRIPNEESDTHTTWHFARRLVERDQDRIWLIPDFNFWAAPAPEGIVGFEEARQLAKRHDSPLIDKIPKAVWRGAVWTNEAVRGALIRATQNKPWADVKEVNWRRRNDMIRTEDVCNYMFLVHTEGQSWSGRLKYLLNCDALVMVHDLDWTTHYYHLLTADGPRQNYISVKRDFSNLQQKVQWLLEHPEHAQKVADNAATIFRQRYTTPAAVACYWRRLFHAWADVAFVPDPYESSHKADELSLRGITIEDFL
ncbi:hypothetical protein K431DRAFT_317127 [Polychaeton citri CBS 116435]|uniref:Glycosyl transferase CAP10 domain-containing protein n=1 Tax=Polychaeton citri CBS 116435 TaxID=1314669 RepID=A0A9P4QH05_9PEZI|nr:hypothetical protein K431DRAFT_317127 [Polychaeton citri CBS 116435]